MIRHGRCSKRRRLHCGIVDVPERLLMRLETGVVSSSLRFFIKADHESTCSTQTGFCFLPRCDRSNPLEMIRYDHEMLESIKYLVFRFSKDDMMFSQLDITLWHLSKNRCVNSIAYLISIGLVHPCKRVYLDEKVFYRSLGTVFHQDMTMISASYIVYVRLLWKFRTIENNPFYSIHQDVFNVILSYFIIDRNEWWSTESFERYAELYEDDFCSVIEARIYSKREQDWDHCGIRSNKFLSGIEWFGLPSVVADQYRNRKV